ncbi:MAG: hypothetical protein R2851_11090 [Caldilineaceae bacterium]
MGWWLAMVAALTAALYSYLFSAFVLPAAGFTLLAMALTGGQVRACVVSWRRGGADHHRRSSCRWRSAPGASAGTKGRPAAPSPTSCPTCAACSRSSPSGACRGRMCGCGCWRCCSSWA